ncbi:T9SS type A sorting domain-containing protein [Jejudonia soesokkakensis]|uniref:T9SS type A sorting domain-containing protein n=1 Tax=Jejudonia soesokkakensis TaxID=1323432 RepID=A0ABW2MX27_9FLAO
MKNPLISLLFIFTISIVNAQIVNIPDPIFKNVLANTLCVDFDNDGVADLSVDLNGDDEIQVSEAEFVNHLILDNQNINSIEGIEAFTNLQNLRCSNNNLVDANLGNLTNLKQAILLSNAIENINISNSSNLEILGLSFNNISNIDLSDATNLKILTISNNQLINLNLSNNLSLEMLQAWGNNITIFDISNHPNIISVDVDDNNITDVNVENCSSLSGFSLSGNPIRQVDMTTNISLLQFVCIDTLLEGVLDLSQNINLEQLAAENTQLSAIDISNGNNENITVMRLTDSPNLTCVQVDRDFGSVPNFWEYDSQTLFSENCSLGITEVALQEAVILYPNPASNVVTIKTVLPIDSIDLFDSHGKKISTEFVENKTIDISNLASGVYFLKIISGNDILHKKLLIE